MSEKWEDPTNKEMRLYAEKAKKGRTMSEDDKPVDEILHESRVKLRREVATQAEKQRRVIVVGLDIPLTNIVSLIFKALFASLFVAFVVFGIPALIFFGIAAG